MDSAHASVKPEEYKAMFERICFVHMKSSVEALLAQMDVDAHYGVPVDSQRLFGWNPSLSTLLFRHPQLLLPLFDQGLREAQSKRLLAFSDLQKADQTSALQGSIKNNAHIRLEYLPPIEPFTKPNISSIRSTDVNKMIQLSGTVIRTGMIKMLEATRQYQCANSKCGHTFVVKSDLEQGNVLDVPQACPSSNNCRSRQFTILNEIKIQEQVQRLAVGSIPRSITVIVQDDLVDSVKAGDDVVVVGILLRRWKPCYKDIRCDLQAVIQANSIRVRNNTTATHFVTEEFKNEFKEFWSLYKGRRLEGRNAILRNICPQVHGLFVVKLAVALTVIGGCSYVDESGMKLRGEPHMLLIGDPGTGKSQFLRFTAELSPRSVLTTGIGTTSAGLTCTAVKDSGEWMLEAGALVLADRGVCCIDEFSGIRSNDRTSIHEAMEQQTLSVAKAGLVCKLNARTSVFAVTNPKGKYDTDSDVSVNTAIASPLLSRFDIILVLLDTANKEWDRTISSFILNKATVRSEDDHVKNAAVATANEAWSVQKLRAYVCWVKEQFQPKLSPEAAQIMQRYYQLQRSADTRNAARTTIRLLESLMRISQAHARLMCRDEVHVQDAIVTVYITETSLATTSMLGLENVLHADFSDDPDQEYYLQEDAILKELNLSHLSSKRKESSSVERLSLQHSPRPSQLSQRRRPSGLRNATHATNTNRVFNTSQKANEEGELTRRNHSTSWTPQQPSSHISVAQVPKRTWREAVWARSQSTSQQFVTKATREGTTLPPPAGRISSFYSAQASNVTRDWNMPSIAERELSQDDAVECTLSDEESYFCMGAHEEGVEGEEEEEEED